MAEAAALWRHRNPAIREHFGSHVNMMFQLDNAYKVRQQHEPGLPLLTASKNRFHIYSYRTTMFQFAYSSVSLQQQQFHCAFLLSFPA